MMFPIFQISTPMQIRKAYCDLKVLSLWVTMNTGQLRCMKMSKRLDAGVNLAFLSANSSLCCST